jgi:uncharacterized protein YecE (DUF72 family)
LQRKDFGEFPQPGVMHGAPFANHAAMSKKPGRAFVGISGYIYPNWRGVFYPRGLPARRELEYASRQFNSIELNGTFYSLKSPAVFSRWYDETPDDFLFAIKGSRFITHMLKLIGIETALANFLASGVLELGRKTGPFLWQFPATYAFDADRVERFLAMLPQNTTDAEAIAREHDHRLKRGASIVASEHVQYRHAFEIRHPSWFCDEFYELLRAYDAALVLADTAGKFPYDEVITTNFVYVRLHGSTQLYVSGYDDPELETWADRIRGWSRLGMDSYTYFDNDAKVYAPRDARNLAEKVAESDEKIGNQRASCR